MIDGPSFGPSLCRALPFAAAAMWANVVVPGSGSTFGPLAVVLLWLLVPAVFGIGISNGWRTDGRTWLAQRTLLLTWRRVELARLTEVRASRLNAFLASTVSVVVLDTNGGWVRINDRRAWGPGFETLLGAALKDRGWKKALQVDEKSYPLYQFLSGDRRSFVRHLQTLHETGRKLIDPRSGIPTHWFGSPAAPSAVPAAGTKRDKPGRSSRSFG